MTQDTDWVVYLEEGGFLGRLDVSSPLVSVPKAWAYGWDRSTAESLAELHGGTVFHREDLD